MKKLFLGIDTSNYMTSVCLVDQDRNVIFERRKSLEVKQGEKGLRQSDAVFQHIKNLPLLFEGIKDSSGNDKICIIAVSEAPRPIEGSYMPVFMPGLSLAYSISNLLDIPLVRTTHQEGHIASGLYSTAGRPEGDQFIVVHLSGGTSEFLFLHKKSYGYNIEKLGGSLDLQVGQLIDRVGQALGLPFPAGSYIEQVAKQSSEDFLRIPSSVRGYSFHLSGAENGAKKMIEQGRDIHEVARGIEHVISVSVEKVLKKILQAGFPKEILLVGGVAQNQYFRDYLAKQLKHKDIGAKLFFADKNYSGDNAFGVANIALNFYLSDMN